PDLADPDPAVRAAAVRALARAGRTHRLIGCLQDEDGDVRLLAAQAMGAWGRKCPQASRPLVQALGDPRADVRWAAAESLCSLSPASVPALCEGLQHANPRIRAGAALAL